MSTLYDEKFHKLVDADLDLIGFNNGIYNIRTEEFFPYSREYLVTKTVGYDFDDSNFELKDDVIKFLREIFADNDIYIYMLSVLSSYLDELRRKTLFLDRGELKTNRKQWKIDTV